MAIVLSLLSALAYGISDFLGGIFAKRSNAWSVATVGQASATVCASVAAFFVAGSPTGPDFVAGAIAGMGSGLGAAFLYRGLANAKMSIVAPISAVGSALLPVCFGLISGERPSPTVIAGIVLAFGAIALISLVKDADPAHRGGVLDGLLAGIGFGVLFIALGQISDDAGLSPLVLMYFTSTMAVIVVAAVSRAGFVPRARSDWSAAWLGPIGVAAVIAFYYATKHGLLSVTSVITALYPASTVLLAAVLLHERVTKWQGVGLALAAVAVSLVALG
ncbi:MAG TPA: DMT family transporter [Aeromicrobium sp.]|nr:DMT family transporter [Aeromicrobium sp.]